jgi:CTP-dependent riboflavin kinase|tara:strand:+ start:425 stop:805 length:381 start_codon:yes stop_codon:yes gene_type:complete
MDSNQITPEMIYKFIDGLYKDTYPGFIQDYRVEVINYKKNTKGLYQPDVIIHVLMDNEVYGNTGLPKGKGYLAVKDMEDKIKSILNYLPYPYNLRIVKYINDSQSQDDTFNFAGIDSFEYKFGVNK